MDGLPRLVDRLVGLHEQQHAILHIDGGAAGLGDVLDLDFDLVPALLELRDGELDVGRAMHPGGDAAYGGPFV